MSRPPGRDDPPRLSIFPADEGAPATGAAGGGDGDRPAAGRTDRSGGQPGDGSGDAPGGTAEQPPGGNRGGDRRENDDDLRATLERLRRAGFDEAEVYAKRGRSRRLVLEPGGRSASFHDERGWAVRAGTARASLFACATGPLDGAPSGGRWPEPDGRPIRLPDPDAAGPAAPWSEPADFETPLLGETEGLRLLEALEESLAEELHDLPGARLLSARLEDGSSDARLASGRGVRVRWRSRVAVLRVEAAAPGPGGEPVRSALHLAWREARRFAPATVARQLADRLVVSAAGCPDDFPGRDRGDLLLAPPAAARLLAALTPLLVGPGAAERLEPFRDRRGRVAAEGLTVVDDGRFPGGVLEAPVDGEGVATRAVALIEGGTFRQPLVSWRAAHARLRSQARGHSGGTAEGRPTGCARRASWRDVPETAPTHLYVAPDPAVAPADLLADLARGYYLLDAAGAPRVDWHRGSFTMPVLGFAVQGGRARGPVAGVELAGNLRALLRGVQAVARDLAFFPLDGMVGSPTLRLSGLELRSAR